MKFLKEQAAMSATELTSEAINNFTSDVEEEEESESEQFSDSPKENEPLWKKILMNVAEFSTLRKNSGDIINESNGRVSPPKINGKHNKNVKYMSLKAHGESLSQGNGIATLIHANIPIYKELLPGLESWQVSKVASWHNLEGHSVQWFCVICIDRRGMLTEVTSALTSVGITICSCVAEIDRRKGVGVMLFHFEGSLESLVNACSSIDLILGVLSWSAGCSWPSSSDNEHYLEC